MLDGLKPYPEYIAASIPGVDAVPAHWRAARIKTALRELDRRSRDGSGTLLSLTRVRGLIRQSDMSSKATTAATLEGYKLYRPGEIVMNRMQAWSGMFGTGPEAGLVSPDYAVFRVLDGNDPAFLVHLLRSPAMVAQFAVESKGIGSGFNRLYTDKFGAIPMPVPPPAEQAGIVRFLGAVDRKVNRFIRAKRRLIEVLTEQKQAIITHAVTKGLNPHAPSKPSGIDWLGDVPEHWEVLDLRWLATKFGSGVTPKGGAQVYQPSGVPFLRSQNVHFSGLRLNGVAHIAPELHAELSGTHVKPFDVLLNITGASIGRACAVPSEFTEGNVNQHVCIIRPRRNRVNSEYLAAFLSTPAIQHEIYLSQNGSSREGLTLQAIRDLAVFVPPIEEQARIVEASADGTRTVANAIAGAEREIDLIREYRTRLVADVVTGKVDVRAAAASIPDEPSDVAAGDQPGEVLDGEGDDSEAGDADAEDAAPPPEEVEA